MKQTISQLVDLVSAGKVVFFCGAGVSFNSGLPLAAAFVARILDGICLSAEEQHEIRDHLPFEAVMEVISTFPGFQGLLHCFTGVKPNANHFFCAELVEAGKLKDIATTNFDLLFETALDAKRIAFRRFENEDQFCKLGEECAVARILKFHGSSSNPQSIRVTLTDVSKRQLASGRKHTVNFVFRDGPHEAVIVLDRK